MAYYPYQTDAITQNILIKFVDMHPPFHNLTETENTFAFLSSKFPFKWTLVGLNNRNHDPTEYSNPKII